jgi:hypothetical protein
MTNASIFGTNDLKLDKVATGATLSSSAKTKLNQSRMS